MIYKIAERESEQSTLYKSPPPKTKRGRKGKDAQKKGEKVSILLIRIILLVFIFLVLFLLLVLFQLLFPECVRLLCVDAGEDEVEDFVVPSYWFAFDAFFDVLRNTLVTCGVMGEDGRGEQKRTSGNSNQSLRLSLGKMTILAPARLAATVFSLSPPMRKTFPVTVNSPVIATVCANGCLSAREINEQAMVIPAEGPSFCTAPSGQCICTLACSKNLLSGKRCARKPLANE